MSDIRNKYHIAINSVGYMLRGAPESPAYTRSVVPSNVNRLAISDLNYSDFAGQGVFYLAQTDWSAGIKTESVWRDDAKYYYSTNLDTYSSQGEIKVEKEVILDENFTEDIYCGALATVGGASNLYVGNYKNGNIKVYKNTDESAGTWSEIAGTAFATSQNAAISLFGHKDLLWVGTLGGGTTTVFQSYDGSSWTDHSAAIATAASFSLRSSRAVCEVGGILYVGVDNYIEGECAIVSTNDAGANWSLVKDFGYYGNIVSMCEYNSKLYYLLITTPTASTKTIFLRMYDPATSSDIIIESYNGVNIATDSVNDKLLKNYNGKLIITLSDRIIEYDGSDLSEIIVRDSKKTAIGYEADFYLYHGCVEREGRLYWSNLIYDGTNFFNFKKNSSDDSGERLYPMIVSSSGIIYYKDTNYDDFLFRDDVTYKETTIKNFIVFNEMSPVVSIDKLLHSVTIMHDKFVSGDEIKVEYSINNRSTWTTADTLTYSSEGGTSVKKEITIAGSILFNKIWWRVSMANTNGTSSPVLTDLIMAYQPMPDFKNRWQMRIDMSNGIKLLNKLNDSREGEDMNSQLWNEKIVKRRVKFQDIDYIECTLKTNMSKTQTSALISSSKLLPMQGRIRAVSGNVAEEMYYTSAKADRILGITRGARGTTARAYPSGQVFDKGYNVYVDDIISTLNFTDEEKTESIAQVLLIET